MGISERLLFIKDAVINKDTSENTINKIKALLTDSERVPVTKAPICDIARASLDVLGIEKYVNSDEVVSYYDDYVLYYKEIFINLINMNKVTT